MIIELNDNKTCELPEGSTAKDLAEKLNLRNPDQALAAYVMGRHATLIRLY